MPPFSPSILIFHYSFSLYQHENRSKFLWKVTLNFLLSRRDKASSSIFLIKNENATISIKKQVGVRYTQRRDRSEKIKPLNNLQLFVHAENTHTYI